MRPVNKGKSGISRGGIPVMPSGRYYATSIYDIIKNKNGGYQLWRIT